MTAPYNRDREVDKPGIVGARWWHDSLVDQEAQIARRAAIRNILVAGAVVAGFGALLTLGVKACSSPPAPPEAAAVPEYRTERQTSLEMQQTYGWSFGAATEPLVFDGETTMPFEPGAVHALERDLAPIQSALVPYSHSTLFRSPDALPPDMSKLDEEEAKAFHPLAESLKPIFTSAMEVAFARGRSLASLFEGLGDPRDPSKPGAASAHAVLFVDLPGPESVAFAAGAASVFEPVFLFDNWPHPRGVVKAQDTLSAAAYYQPLFAGERARKTASLRPAMFVLDRNRLAHYADDATQFDNRYVAKVPHTMAALKSIGAAHVLYVAPENKSAPFELEDLNDWFVIYAAGGIDVRVLTLDLLARDAAEAAHLDAGTALTAPYYYGGSKRAHQAFFVDYPWARSPRPVTGPSPENPGKSYTPVPRETPYSSGHPDPDGYRVTPAAFATVPVAVAVATGVVLGARYARSGSWNRTTASGSWGGG
ncbi:MAG: hypothetical protein JWP97_5854 [Labilithrix sp.]|nr:hypothetical protein [Labilithrix sp.]